MGIFDWFNPNEEDTTTFEISNDQGEQVVFTLPTRGSNKIRKTLRDAGFQKDNDDRVVRNREYEDIQDRDSQQLRWWAQRDINEKEDDENSFDAEPLDEREPEPLEGAFDVDDEESEQTALRFWPRW